MRVYVAGKWEEKARVREVQQQLRDAGHVITHDWTSEEEVGITQEHAVNDKNGVLTADAFIGIFEKDLRYSGALSEMGIAIAKGIPIHILGDAINNNIFLMLPEVRRGISTLLEGL